MTTGWMLGGHLAPNCQGWEDATDRRLIELDANIVRLTPTGRAYLEEHRLSK